MSYYTIWLDPDNQKIYPILLPWCKYSYLCLPMDIFCPQDIFQTRTSDPMQTPEYVRTYINDLIVITMGTFDNHLEKVSIVLRCLEDPHFYINTSKSYFVLPEIEYLSYLLTRDVIKLQPERIAAVLALKEPNSVKTPRNFLGVVQYYCKVWVHTTHMIAPLTDLLGEVDETKVTKEKGANKKWYWAQIHQDVFEAIKQILAKVAILAYYAYSLFFQIYTDPLTCQSETILMQNEKPLVFFLRKLTYKQQQCSVTELELLSIVACLKECESILWGQSLKVFTDPKNPVHDVLGLTCNNVYR